MAVPGQGRVHESRIQILSMGVNSVQIYSQISEDFMNNAVEQITEWTEHKSEWNSQYSQVLWHSPATMSDFIVQF